MEKIKIDGFENYYVDKNGNVYCKKNNEFKIKKISIDRYGYCYSSFTNSKKENKKMKIHRIVALTYLENPLKKPTVNHKDGNKLNNSVENLEWATSKEQSKHYLNLFKNKNNNKKTIYIFDNELNIIDKQDSVSLIMKKYKVCKSFIVGSLKKSYFSRQTKHNIFLSYKEEKPIFKAQKFGNIKLKELNDNKIFNSIKEASDFYKLKKDYIRENLKIKNGFFHNFKNGQKNRFFNFVKI